MRNAKEEFISLISHDYIKSEVKCATIYREYNYEEDPFTRVNLPCNYTQEQYNKFLEALDFEYDAGYGEQELFGLVWFKDDTWADRYEYDGSESWDYHICPEIPLTLV